MIQADTSETRGSAPSLPGEREIPGRWVVVGLLLFGVVMTGGMWVYWKLHLGPFLPLQKALFEAYPHSAPQVAGGRHKDSPLILRVVLNVPFTPRRDSPEIRGMIERIIELARQHQRLGDYEILEMHFVHSIPERLAERLTVELKVAELPSAEKG